MEEINIEEEFVQDSQEVAALAADNSALVEYKPKSKAPFRINTLIPRNMSFEVQKSLNRIVQQKGNIDNYVRTHLKYRSKEKLWKGLAAEQVDSLGLYLAQFERGQGIIIADQTGIGKGRQAAAIVRHAIVNDYLPVFFTRKSDLFTDLYRDLKNIGFPEINPFILNTDSLSRVKDSEGQIVFSPLSAHEQSQLISTSRTIPSDSLESINWHRQLKKPLPDFDKTPTIEISDVIDYLPKDYDCIFCTYSQIQVAAAYKKLWLSKLVKAGVEGSKKYKKVVFILDESHMAGGYDSIVGVWMRSTLPSTKACCFLSATFAKYPEVMPFYAKKTAIQESGLDDFGFVNSMSRGGLALQEIVASNLAESGQLIRRQRSQEGVSFDFITLDEEPRRSLNRDRVNQVVKIMNEIVSFESNHISPHLQILHEQAYKQNEYVQERPKQLGVNKAPFFSRVFNIVDQMLFALKVDDVAKQTIKLLEEDKKVVIAFKSTMGTYLKDLGLVSGDVIPLELMDFARTLRKALDSIFYYNYIDIKGGKTRRKVALEDLSPQAIEKYEEIQAFIESVTTGLTISPIDRLIYLIESAIKSKGIGGHNGKKYRVGEITGRNQRAVFDGELSTIYAFKSDAEKSFRLFNSGELDVLLLNQSGSTGYSAHSSVDFLDQRQRFMIIHQLELDINILVQIMGRVNRTGQVNYPGFLFMSTEIPLENRLMSMAKSKLKSLDANTTGSQNTNKELLEAHDIFNKYGDVVARDWIRENPFLGEKMGRPGYHEEDMESGRSWVLNASIYGLMKQLTGRVGLLEVDEQDKLYRELLEKYEHKIEWEKQRGTYDLEIEFLKLDADVRARFLFQKGKGGNTPFGKDTVRDLTIINNLSRPFTLEEIDNRIVNILNGQKPEKIRGDLIRELNKRYPEIVDRLTRKREETIYKLEIEVEELEDLEEAETDKKERRKQAEIKRIRELIRKKDVALKKYEEELEKVRKLLVKNIDLMDIGEPVNIPIPGTLGSSYGIFLGVHIGAAKNPYALGNVSLIFAVADHRKLVEFNFTPDQFSFIRAIHKASATLEERHHQEIRADWNDYIKYTSHKREERHILTENIVGASDKIGQANKLIKYNTKDGLIKNGILMTYRFDEDPKNLRALIPISNAYQWIQNMSDKEMFADHQVRVKLKRINETSYNVFIPKNGNQDIFTDEQLRNLIDKQEGQGADELAEFVQKANEMTASLSLLNLKPFLERLDTFGLHCYGAEKELEDWEIENQEDWAKRVQGDGEFSYKLSRPYGQRSNPLTGFLDHKEPTTDFPHGIVIYNRSLSDVEKYNYGLVPLFKNIEEPYLAWKEHFRGTHVDEQYNDYLKEIKGKSMAESIVGLGYFIANNPHEEGNLKFVFGEYTPEELGRVAFEEAFGQIGALDELLEQLTIELHEERV